MDLHLCTDDHNEVRPGEFSIRGACLHIRSMVFRREDELVRFLLTLDPKTDSDRRFLEKLLGYFKVVANEAEACSDTYFRRLFGEPDQWEIRVQRGKANWRFYGFLAPDRTFWVVSVRDKRADRPDPAAVSRVTEARARWMAIHAEH
ncbi:MAG: hypothetical protein KBI47_04225 [Armatimonadetes bacterium]|nr:hypothetical protein [Armatimonadota bacterium]